MSRFRKLSQTLWHCQYHIVFVPKYRLRILTGDVAQEVNNCIRAFVEQQKAELVELNIQIDHVHCVPRSGECNESTLKIIFNACCIEDEGRPFGFCFQERDSNRLEAASVKS